MTIRMILFFMFWLLSTASAFAMPSTMVNLPISTMDDPPIAIVRGVVPESYSMRVFVPSLKKEEDAPIAPVLLRARIKNDNDVIVTVPGVYSGETVILQLSNIDAPTTRFIAYSLDQPGRVNDKGTDDDNRQLRQYINDGPVNFIINDPPVAYNTAPSTTESSPYWGTLKARDWDNNDLQYTIMAQGSLGVAKITNPATGEFSYTPNPKTTGIDHFTFKVNDGKVDSNTATVTVTINKVEQFFTSISTELSSRSIVQTGSLDISGKMTRLPDNGSDLSGIALVVRIKAPDGSIITKNIKTYDKFGHYELKGVTGLTQKGNYSIEVAFEGSLSLTESKKAESVLVGSSAGYAIIVQGKMDNEEGLASHNKTTNRIYQAFMRRGFRSEDIRYFNYDTSQTGVYATPTKTSIKDAIQTWVKQKMNEVAAPFYLILVDHGNINTFYLGAEQITPVELDGWIKILESGLNPTAAQEKKIILFGACYSGSFLPDLSHAGRIIVSSSAANEESFKGPMEPDKIRVGEFFMEELFREWRRGTTLNDAFQLAAAKTRIYTRKGSGSNSQGIYQDAAMQHPLLDDNGDKIGSNDLNDARGDGQQAKAIYLGTGMTNSVSNPADLVEVTETLSLSSDQSTAFLWAKAKDDAKVSSAWVEVRSPTKILSGKGGTNQLEIDLDKSLLTYASSFKMWATQQGGFDVPGLYEIYYFSRDVETGNLSPMMRSLVYKQKAGNAAPAAFSLLSPANAAQSKTVAIFNWNPSTDADGLTYNLIIAKDNAFKDVVYRKEEILNTYTFVDETAQLTDLTTYYWKIQAVDAYGSITDSKETWSFKTENTNGIPGIVFGLLMKPDASPAAHATVKVNDTVVQTGSDGSFITLANPGNVSVSGGQSATQQSNVSFLEIKGGKAIRIKLTMQTDPHTTSSVPTTPILDVDKSGTVDATDGVLLLRKLNGASTIDTGVMLPTGQNNTSVLATINAIGSKLDVDQSGLVDATDGVLILRKLNGASTIDTGVMLPTGQTNSSVLTAIDAIAK
ncbi:MAG: Ig-like domain-containing protein [Magnetococcus sp. YQC-5]